MYVKNFLKYALYLLCFIAATACSSGSENGEGSKDPNGPGTPDQPDKPTLSIAGSWELTDWSLDSNKLIEAGDIQVYLECTADNTFTLYQLTASGAEFKKLSGTYSIKDRLLSGTYRDGSKWANDYTIKELDQKTMKWEYGSGVTMTYTAGDIPREIVENAQTASAPAARSEVDEKELTVIL